MHMPSLARPRVLVSLFAVSCLGSVAGCSSGDERPARAWNYGAPAPSSRCGDAARLVGDRCRPCPDGGCSEDERTNVRRDAGPVSDDANVDVFDDPADENETPCLEIEPSETLDFGSTTTGLPPNGVRTKRPITLEHCRPEADTPLEITDVRLTDDADGAFDIESVALPEPLRDGETLTLDGGESETFPVVFVPTETGSYRGELVVESNAPENGGRRSLELRGEGTSDNQCPESVPEVRTRRWKSWQTDATVAPQTTVELRGTKSSDPDGTVESYEWSVLKKPELAFVSLRPDSNVSKPTFEPQLAGTYQFELAVRDDDGCTTRSVLTIRSEPQSDLWIELLWETPADDNPRDNTGTDLDLHYVRPTDSPTPNWNDRTNDIFWSNKTADWGKAGREADDPEMTIDNTKGRGPEVVTHDNPNPDESYKVGVHYFADRGLGASDATLRLYYDGTLKRELQDQRLPGTDTFWYAGQIDWKNEIFLERDQVQKGFPTR
jgi:hypothetical protein